MSSLTSMCIQFHTHTRMCIHVYPPQTWTSPCPTTCFCLLEGHQQLLFVCLCHISLYQEVLSRVFWPLTDNWSVTVKMQHTSSSLEHQGCVLHWKLLMGHQPQLGNLLWTLCGPMENLAVVDVLLAILLCRGTSETAQVHSLTGRKYSFFS